MANKKNKTDEYNEDSIKIYEYPVNIQKKPSMYIGSIGEEGCTHMIREVVDNSCDEALNGYGSTITIHISNDKGYVSVEDEGRGIPPTAIEKAFCTLHASGKFNNAEYATSAGTNGVGTTAVNALSKSFIVESVRDGKAYVQKFSDGLAITELMKTGTRKKKSGTTVYFEPNKKFMGEVKFDYNTISNEIVEKSYCLKGIKTILINDDNKEKIEVCSKNGLIDFITESIKKEDKISSNISINSDIEFDREIDDENVNLKFNVEIVMAYTKKSVTKISSYCNSLLMREGGIQETTLKKTLTIFFKKYIQEKKLLPKKDEKLLEKITGDNINDGLVAIISIKHPDPIFENQTKNKLKSVEVAKIGRPITEALENFAISNEKEMKNICMKIITSVRASEAARAAREKVKNNGDKLIIMSDLSKLADCNMKDPEKCEIFLTEGNSASGTAKEARDKRYQAVYSLRGKMLNTLLLTIKRVLENKECADLAYAFTGEKDGIGENFKIEKMKYAKVIALADADDDGKHIAMLIMTYLFAHMIDIILEEKFFIAIPPLYSIVENNKKRYFIDQKEYDEYISEKIMNEYEFVNQDEEDMTSEEIMSAFHLFDKLISFVKEISDSTVGITMDLIIDLIDEIVRTEYTEETVENFFDEFCNDIIKTDDNYEGFYNGKFVSFNIVDIYEILDRICDFVNDNEIPNDEIYYLNSDGEYLLFSMNEYKDLIDKVTPSSRTRLKGLGEMDPDELWETTLNPEKRNLYKVKIDNLEKAELSMHNFMNGDGKFADFRKHVLLERQKNKED